MLAARERKEHKEKYGKHSTLNIQRSISKGLGAFTLKVECSMLSVECFPKNKNGRPLLVARRECC
jgi:hypothetical protein